jgi:hypothetical protein
MASSHREVVRAPRAVSLAGARSDAAVAVTQVGKSSGRSFVAAFGQCTQPPTQLCMNSASSSCVTLADGIAATTKAFVISELQTSTCRVSTIVAQPGVIVATTTKRTSAETRRDALSFPPTTTANPDVGPPTGQDFRLIFGVEVPRPNAQHRAAVSRPPQAAPSRRCR